MLRRRAAIRHIYAGVAGPPGHLFNTQAAGILVKHVKQGVDVWLAHLGRRTIHRACRAALAPETVGFGLVRVMAQRNKPGTLERSSPTAPTRTFRRETG